MQERLQVKMLGGFSIRLGDRVIDDSNNRMKKVWLVLAYLIYSRNTPSSPNDCLPPVCFKKRAHQKTWCAQTVGITARPYSTWCSTFRQS